MNKLLEYFTKLQNKLFAYTTIGIDVQKIQTAILVIMTMLHLGYAVFSFVVLDFKSTYYSVSLAIIFFYYAMALNQVLQED